MGVKKDDSKETITEAPDVIAAEDVTAPVPFVVPPAQNAPPNEAQMRWLATHPNYRRISHSVLGRFAGRGTLTVDGEFVPESKSPIHDGGGSFGVGVAV